ncbi:MAG: PEP-CTERM sorting domain-containing protein, partial [Proteobacteria bacterium]|nr:PEP-CTERM sorting domain-containing protein [Pseudomonadota bacterium]
GKISFTVITAVPEPETYAMVLAGLGLIGFMTYRRKLKEAA